MKSAAKGVLFRLVLVTLSVLLSIVLGEALLRVAYSPPYKFSLCGGSDYFDPRFGMAMRPNYRCTSKTRAILSNTPRVEQSLFSNSYGLRDTEPTVPRPTNTFRVMFLGDSFVAAWHVLLDETIAHEFKGIYEQSGGSGSLDVISAGVSGFCTFQEVEWYLNVGRLLDPNVVFVVFTWNDVASYKIYMTNRVSNGFYRPSGIDGVRKVAGITFIKPFKPDVFFTMNRATIYLTQ